MSDENESKPSEGTPEDLKKEAEALEASLLKKIRGIIKEELVKEDKQENQGNKDDANIEKSKIKDKEPEKKPDEKPIIKGFAGEQPPDAGKLPGEMEKSDEPFFNEWFGMIHNVKKFYGWR